MENIRILSLFEYRISKYPNTLCVFFQSPNILFLSIMRINQNTYRSAKKSEWPTLFKIHKYFLPVRILGRLTASAEATSVPLSSLSVLPSPLAGWIVRDKGEHHSDNYHGSCPSKFTMSTLYTLSLYCRVQVLEE